MRSSLRSAAAGLSVLLLDHKDFPRAKACAGGLTSKAVQALRYSIAPVVRKVVGRVRLEGDPDFLYAAPDMTARAAFVKESRMKLATNASLFARGRSSAEEPRTHLRNDGAG